MENELHVHFHFDGLTVNVNHVMSVDDELFNLIHSIKEEFAKMDANVQAALDDLTAQVAADTTEEESAITLINGIPALIAAAVATATAAGATPAQLQGFTDLSAQMKASSDKLAAAVVANTPAA